MYANRQHSPMTIRSVNVIVATHSEAATGALAVKSICLIINVFSFSLKEQTSFRTEITVPQIHIYTLKAIIQKVILYYISKR